MSADDTRRRSGYGPRDLHRAVLHHGGRAYQVAVESESLVLRQPHARADRAPITVATARLDETRHAIVRFEWDTEMAPADRPALAPLREALEDLLRQVIPPPRPKKLLICRVCGREGADREVCGSCRRASAAAAWTEGAVTEGAVP